MKNQNHSLRTRLTALLLALICVFGLFPTTAFAAADTIKLKDFGMSGVAYQSRGTGPLHAPSNVLRKRLRNNRGLLRHQGSRNGQQLEGPDMGK